MSMRWTAAGAALAMLAFSPSLAMAADADVERQINEMQQRMQQMEDKLQATTDQLDSANQRVDEQSKLIEQSGLVETRGSSSGLPGFLGEITVGGWVAASYFYNVNDPQDADRCDGLGPDFSCDDPNVFFDEETGTFLVFDDNGDPLTGGGPFVFNNTGNNAFAEGAGGLGGTNQGMNGRFYPLHPDHNSFSLDQVWWEIERPIDEENRAGFRLDTVYGKTGALLNGGGPSNRRDGIRDDTAFYLHQGYVQYMAPVGDGLTFKAGKLATPLGVEVAQTVYNWNITRGNVWNLLEPIDHIGVTAGYALGDTGLDFMFGGVNGFLPDDPDRNDQKSVIGHIGWANDTITAAVNGIYGSETQGNDGNESGVVNGLLKINATDRLGFWINGDYAWLQDSDSAAWGVAAAGRFGITERTGISLRGEYVADVDGYLGFQGLSFAGVTPTNGEVEALFFTGIEVWGITATIDHLLTDHLMIRAEARYDNIDKDSTDNEDFFQDSVGNFDNDQIVVGAEVIYNFNKFGGE